MTDGQRLGIAALTAFIISVLVACGMQAAAERVLIQPEPLPDASAPSVPCAEVAR